MNNDLQEQLRILFQHGFKSKYVISSGKQVPDDYAIRGYLPSRMLHPTVLTRSNLKMFQKKTQFILRPQGQAYPLYLS